MICDSCKENNASVIFKQVVNGENVEMNLCQSCWLKMQMSMDFGNMFKLLFNNYANENYKMQTSNQLTCPTCGYSFSELKSKGKLGCEDCYETFKIQIRNVLENVQSSNKHVGKVPNRMKMTQSIDNELEKLKQNLKSAIEKEEYEDAATFRDRIRELERGNS